MVLAGSPGTPSGIRLFDVVDVSHAKGGCQRGQTPLARRCQAPWRWRGGQPPLNVGVRRLNGGGGVRPLWMKVPGVLVVGSA